VSSDIRLVGDLMIFFVAGLYFVQSGLRDYLFIQKIKSTPVSKVGAAAVGFVELSGEAEDAAAPLKSPVSCTPCTYWKITGEYYHGGKGAGWYSIYLAQSREDFIIQDDTGRLPVRPDGARVEMSPSQIFEGYMYKPGAQPLEDEPMDERAMRYIWSLSGTARDLFRLHSFQKIRITEYCLVDDMPLYVIGSAVPADKATDPSCPGPLEISKGPNDKTIYFSTLPEHSVLENHSRWLSLRIFGGLAVSCVTLFALLIVVGLMRDALFALSIALGLLAVCFVLSKLGIW
jgi:hypothetical protein